MFNAAEIMDQMKGIGHRLGGMIDIALQIDQCGPLGQHTLLMPLAHCPGHLLHIGVALPDINVITDADDLR